MPILKDRVSQLEFMIEQMQKELRNIREIQKHEQEKAVEKGIQLHRPRMRGAI